VVFPAVKVLYENIPAQFTKLNRRVVWQNKEWNGKLTRPPYVPAQGKKRHAVVNVLSTWRTVEQAKTSRNPVVYTGSELFFDGNYPDLHHFSLAL
jgi:hypothetical protein